MLSIRPEKPRDYMAVRDVLMCAFKGHRYSNEMEYRLVELLREQNALTFALVAEKNGELVGHIAFSPIAFDGKELNWFALAPVAVRPENQNQKIGSALILAGLDELKNRNAAGCLLVGEPAYYTRFGFVPHPGIFVEGVSSEYVMQISLEGNVPQGTVMFHPAFDVCSH